MYSEVWESRLPHNPATRRSKLITTKTKGLPKNTSELWSTVMQNSAQSFCYDLDKIKTQVSTFLKTLAAKERWTVIPITPLETLGINGVMAK
jgi:hypothetical protein